MRRLLALTVAALAFLVTAPGHAHPLRPGDILALTLDGAIIQVDPVTGSQAVVASGGLLSDFATGIAVTPWRELFVVQSGDTVVRVAPFTGEEAIVTQGGLLVNSDDITVDAGGNLFLTSNAGSPFELCPGDGISFVLKSVIRVDPTTGLQSRVQGCVPVIIITPLELEFAPDGVVLLVLDLALDGSFGGVAAIDTATGSARAKLFCGGSFIWPIDFGVAPDGRIIVACLNTATARHELLVFDANGAFQRHVPSTRSFRQLAVEETAHLIAVSAAPDGGSGIYRVDLLSGEDTFLTSVSGEVSDIVIVPPICPCNAPWKNRGAYVSCVAHKVNGFAAEGFITRAEHAALVSSARESSCGHK